MSAVNSAFIVGAVSGAFIAALVTIALAVLIHCKAAERIARLAKENGWMLASRRIARDGEATYPPMEQTGPDRPALRLVKGVGPDGEPVGILTEPTAPYTR